ncbi:tRNA adenosine(34) deaminase TadA [uncultured Actinomyces sp.]|uniref:tRNA adenosine(34) deaminase TadA n=1 Tax=uncultured Actinomyces sp. TaxID=249061 RepID=UPI00260C3C74|nr:tRNA adenosine(34) deaminase TadA [uncultured Actinomyces sp.]
MADHSFPKRVEIHGTKNLKAHLAQVAQRAAVKAQMDLQEVRTDAVTPPAGYKNPPVPSEMKSIYEHAMGRALYLADRARAGGDVPVGAVVIDQWGTILGEGWNTREAEADPVGHAEISALRDAAKQRGTWRLDDLTLVVTLEPCTMCAGAIVNARIKRLVMGAWDPKAGAAGSIRDVVRDSRLNHQVEVIPEILRTECEIQLRGFFSTRRTM